MSVQSCGLSQHERGGAQEPLVVPPKDAWRLLGISNSKGYELLSAGELDFVKFGRATRITMESIHRRIKQGLAAAKSSTP
jgi:excisionase family DNA binding protein